VAQATRTSVAESQQATNELADVTDRLRSLVGQFRY
jgi:methyl-accepting chemotaxis protein